MSIKKLFESTNKNKNYLEGTDEKNAFKDVESSANAEAISLKQETFVPQLDYKDPANFARYGSAYLYYKSAISRILDYYPYDGSDAEINTFYNESLDIEKYIFDKMYPRSTGYINMGQSWGSVSEAPSADNFQYGLPSNLEYIRFYGGPHTTNASSLVEKAPNPYNNKFQEANIYDTDIYTTAGLPSAYGSGSRASNLACNFDRGVTLEFWLTTGSANTLDQDAGGTGTQKQVIFDLWNNETVRADGATTVDYGRITLELNGTASASPFLLTVQSGAAGTGKREVFQQTIGTGDVDPNTLNRWHHYALVLENTGSTADSSDRFKVTFYVDGRVNQIQTYTGQMPTLNPKNTVAQLGSLLTRPASPGLSTCTATTGSGKLSGSLDEFRFWKTARSAQEIGTHWFSQVRGGANSDISNADLGVYYKFNEGITNETTLDSVVLDYSGRITNGAWTGYSATSRNTGSAILSASAASKEYRDPIIYSNHPSVAALKTSLLASGSNHDTNNQTAFLNYMPGWVIEEHEDSEDDNHLAAISHVAGAYFDNLASLIEAVPSFKSKTYTSASHKPYSFAKHLPQSLGMYVPELYVDSTVRERFLNRDEDSFFEGDLTDTKNLIYLNLYNNLAGIYKSKGTEKAIRNVYRCFNLDQGLVRLNVYSNNNVYELENNLQQVIDERKSLNFNTSYNTKGVVYQRQSGAYGTSAAYQTDTTGSITGAAPPYTGAEDIYGLTLEADVEFPSFSLSDDPLYNIHQQKEMSIFGMHTVDTGSCESLFGTDTTWVSNFPSGRGGTQPDFANLQVSFVRDPNNIKNGYFRLTSSNYPYFVPELTSSIFNNVYDNDRWNIAVRVKPSNYPYADIVSGATSYTYDVEFRGVNTRLGDVQDRFLLTGTIGSGLTITSKQAGQFLLRSHKRVYVGARRTNITGTLLTGSDVKFAGIRYWGKYIEDRTLDQHAFDYDNVGISGTYEHISFKDPNLTNQDVLNSNMLFLDWKFNKITGSNVNGNFTTTDFSSGSALLRDNYGWIGNYHGYQHSGYGYGFATSSTDVIINEKVNSFKFIDPERVVGSDMIQILSDDDKVYGYRDAIPSYRYTLEKSMHNAISEEMLDFFAGVVDFNNIIGDPVNKYRARYKAMEKLRQSFFQRVTKVSTVEKYLKYYKWFDDAIAEVVSQIVPASADFNSQTLNVVESHVLERNKYRHIFPTTEFTQPDLSIALEGLYASLYPGLLGRSTLAASPRPTNKHNTYWRERAERSAAEITSGDATIDEQRKIFTDQIYSFPSLSSSATMAYTKLKAAYPTHRYAKRRFGRVYRFDVETPIKPFHGGVNFDLENKSLEFTFRALYPAGPVTSDDEVYVPQNVLLSFQQDLQDLPEIDDNERKYGQIDFRPNKKIKRNAKVYHGRNWKDGTGYNTTISKFSFPFNLISSSVKTGFNKQIVDGYAPDIELTNLHHDTYGDTFEVPMQGPFANDHVGGHQSRHIALNKSGSAMANLRQKFGGLDNYLTRPEAWKIVTGRCTDNSGALGMIGADYPWPEANNEGENPYPMTGAQKAVYYRDYIAKRPVNIRNIEYTTGSRFLGNYQHNYQVINSVGTNATPRRFMDQPGTFPAKSFDNNLKPTSINIIQNINRGTSAPSSSDATPGTSSHFDYGLEYTPTGITGSKNQSIFIGRFRAPGGREVQSRGFLDIRGYEYSVYNSMNNRNLLVRMPQQAPSGSPDRQTQGIRVIDIHGKDWGLNPLLARHTQRFGRDSYWITGTTALCDGPVYTAGGPGAAPPLAREPLQYPGFHKIHRNNIKRMKIESCREEAIYDCAQANLNALGFAMDGNSDNRSESLMKSGSFSTDLTRLTLSIWMYRMNTGNTGQERGILTFGDDINNNGNANSGVAKGKPTFQLYCSSDYIPKFRTKSPNGNDGIWSMDVSDAIPANQWTHLALTYDGTQLTNHPTFYINGVSQSVTSFQSPADLMGTIKDKYPGHCRIFNRWTNGTDGYQVLSGTIADEVSIYRCILSASEISALYANGTALNLTCSTSPHIASTTLSVALAIGGTTITVDSTDGFAESGMIGIGNELIKYNGLTSTTFTGITRAANDTSQGSHGVGDSVTQEDLVTWLRLGDRSNDWAWTDAQLTASSAGDGKEYPPQSAAAFRDVKGNNNYGIRSANGLNARENMVFNGNGGVEGSSGWAVDPVPGSTGVLSAFREVCTYVTGAQYDNWYVQHPIPRTDIQYKWIGASVTSSKDTLINRYSQFSPYQRSRGFKYPLLEGLYSSSAGYEAWFTFVSGTQPWKGSGSWGKRLTHQPPIALNTLTLDSLDIYDNVLGSLSPDGLVMTPDQALTSSRDKYFNKTLQNAMGITAPNIDFNSNYLNLLLTRRGSTYGWAWQQLRQESNPILRNERLSCSISITSPNGDGVVDRYRLSPVTTKGRPALVNLNSMRSPEKDTIDPTAHGQEHALGNMKNDANPVNNMTLKVTNNNEKLFFDDNLLNDLYPVKLRDVVTPYDQIVKIVKSPPYNLRWILYTEGVFPTLFNEFYSGSTQRLGFDNGYWRDSPTLRISEGDATNNSFGIKVWQSEWCLDAPREFLTRVSPTQSVDAGGIVATTNTSNDTLTMKRYSQAGELQNEYCSWFKGSSADIQGISSGQRYASWAPAALYSRPHVLKSKASVVSPTGPRIAETGSIPAFGGKSPLRGPNLMPDQFGGQALWEAGTKAGIVEGVGTSASFVPYPSSPWWDSYDDYRYQLKLVAKDYAIVPEFRISEHVEDYKKYGILNRAKMDTFEIVGTQYNSTSASFYRDYSNSEFLKDFLKVKRDSLLSAQEIRLVCSAAIRLNPYKGFYPAQRTLDLVSQFSRSYGAGIQGAAPQSNLLPSPGQPLLSGNAALMQPVLTPLFAPGILYNSIKSGMAVDYPVVTDRMKFSASFFGPEAIDSGGTLPDSGSIDGFFNQWALCGATENAATKNKQDNNSFDIGWASGSIWDQRVPFEAIVNPKQHIRGTSFRNLEAHPTMSMPDVSSSWDGTTDGLYSMMAQNFFGETANFFLKDGRFTSLTSQVMSNEMRFKRGSVYAARVKLRRSTTGPRTYQNESCSYGDNSMFTKYGALPVSASAVQTGQGGIKSTLSGSIPLPQDPMKNPLFKENFTLYSRPTAFGPPISGRPSRVDTAVTHSLYDEYSANASSYGTMDCFDGFNWSYTPPYYNGEAWADIIFWPDYSETYDLEKILSEVKVIYRRHDAGPDVPIEGINQDNTHVGPSLSVEWTKGIKDGVSHITFQNGQVYSGRNIDANAMQISASLNLFGVAPVFEQETDKFGNVIKNTNKIAGKRWIIQPKWETPHMNFNDEGLNPITNASSNLSIPTYASASVPRGMWHQFGIMEPDPTKGIFMEIGDIPKEWLKYHYDVVSKASDYNNNNIQQGKKMYQTVESLTDLMGFEKHGTTKRLGEVAEGHVIREAVVAIPYIIESVRKPPSQLLNASIVSGEFASQRKKFINIPIKRYNAALQEGEGSMIGDTLDTAGSSIRKLVQKMGRYVMPPQFDFVNNTSIDPIVMYMFEFEYKLDKDDLAYIWQNTAPRNYEKITLEQSSVAHELMDTELLTEKNLTENQNLRWMVFKVKQRSQNKYEDLVTNQVAQVQTQTQYGNFQMARRQDLLLVLWPPAQPSGPSNQTPRQNQPNSYAVDFNWPYDYLSFVELIKMDVQVLYRAGPQKDQHNREMIAKRASMPASLRQASVLKGGSGLVVTTNEVATAIAAETSKKSVIDVVFNPPTVVTKESSPSGMNSPRTGRKVSVTTEKTGLSTSTQTPDTTKTGKTSYNANHIHQYNVDANGNGWTEYAYHPNAPQVKHRHRIINNVVQEAQSSCYPDCKRRYGVDGAPRHQHTIGGSSNTPGGSGGGSIKTTSGGSKISMPGGISGRGSIKTGGGSY